jgi:hypothetical protein
MASIKIREVPEYAKPIVYAFGLATINWGKMEQALEMLLHSVNRDHYHIGYVEKFPTTSFRLKVNLFRDWFVEHPSFAEIHPVAKPVCAGLKKANTSRILMTHSAVIEFKPGPPATAEVNVAQPEMITVPSPMVRGRNKTSLRRDCYSATSGRPS